VSSFVGSFHHKHNISSDFFDVWIGNIIHDMCSFECIQMQWIIWYSTVVGSFPDESRKDSSKFGSCYFAVWIKIANTYTHKSKLTCRLDIKFHFIALCTYVVEYTAFVGIWSQSSNFDSKATHHFGHMRSDKCSFHIRFLDSRHRSNTMCICPKIGIVEFCRICWSYDTSDRKCDSCSGSWTSSSSCSNCSCARTSES